MTHQRSVSPSPGNPSVRAARTLEPYLAPVYSLCYRLLNDPVQAEDATQETFLDAIKIWDHFVPPSPAADPGSSSAAKDPRLQWLLAIAARRALSARRSAARFTPLPEPAMEPSHEQTPSAAAEQAETARRLEAALRELPAEEREAVVLHHIGGLTQAEIAQTLALPPRTVSHRISDGLAALRERLERGERTGSAAPSAAPAGGSRLASLGALLIALPPLPAPTGLAAKLFARPEILAWSPSSGVATASTATTGAAGAAPVPATAPLGAAASPVTTKGATLMSSKLMLAASAAVLAATFMAWSTGALDPAPVFSESSAPERLATAAPVTPGAGALPVQRVANSSAGDAVTAGGPADPVTPPAPQITPAELEAAYVKNLTAEQAAARAALAKCFDQSFKARPSQGPARGPFSSEWVTLNTSLGLFDLKHLNGTGTVSNRLYLNPALAGGTPAFIWNNFKVEHASATISESDLVSQSRSLSEVTSCGRRVKLTITPDGGAVKQAVDETPQRLLPRDVWPDSLPARYDLKSVLDRIGLALMEPADLAALLAAAQKADADFLAAAQAWQVAQTQPDPAAVAAAGAAGWQAGKALTAAQWAVCQALEKHLADTQSGPAAWAVLTVSGSEGGGFTLPALSFELGHVTANGTAGHDQSPASLKNQKMKMPVNRSYKLEIGDETLAHLAQVINQNPGAGGAVSIDPAVAKTTVAGTLTGTSLEDLIKNLATTAEVDCQPDGVNRWKLVPKPAVPATGDGF